MTKITSSGIEEIMTKFFGISEIRNLVAPLVLSYPILILNFETLCWNTYIGFYVDYVV